MAVCGIILLYSTASTDLGESKWWHHLSYIPNIVAAFTGFLIGVPVALVILATFTREAGDTAALNRVNSLSGLAWEKFRDSVLELCSDQRSFEGLGQHADMVRTTHNRILAEYRKYTNLARTWDEDKYNYRSTTDEETVAFQDYLQREHAIFQRQIYEVLRSVGSQYNLQILGSQIRRNWNTVDQYVRLQRLERSLNWFDDRLDADISNRIADQLHPLTKFLLVEEVDQSRSTASMGEALKIVARDMDMPIEGLAIKFTAGPSPSGMIGDKYREEFGHKDVENHQSHAHAAQESLFALRNSVTQVDNAGWPLEM